LEYVYRLAWFATKWIFDVDTTVYAYCEHNQGFTAETRQLCLLAKLWFVVELSRPK